MFKMAGCAFVLLLLLCAFFASCSSVSAFEKMRKDASVTVELSNLYRNNDDRDGELNTLLSFAEQYSLTADPQVAYNLAVRYYEDKEYGKALDICIPCIDAYKAHSRFRKLACSCHIALGDYGKAWEMYDSILDSGEAITEKDVLQMCAFIDEHSIPEGKKKVIETAMKNGLFTKDILTIAAEMNPDEDEYDMLLRYAK